MGYFGGSALCYRKVLHAIVLLILYAWGGVTGGVCGIAVSCFAPISTLKGETARIPINCLGFSNLSRYCGWPNSYDTVTPCLFGPAHPKTPRPTPQSMFSSLNALAKTLASSLNLSSCPLATAIITDGPASLVVPACASQCRTFIKLAATKMAANWSEKVSGSPMCTSKTMSSTIVLWYGANRSINLLTSALSRTRRFIRCSSLARARFASAAACSAKAARSSALAARSVTSAICASACSCARLADLAMNSPIATSAKTPIVTRAFPITSRCGQRLVMNAVHASGPDSINKPMTTSSPAKNVATSRPSSSKPTFISLLVGPFIRRRRYSGNGKNGPLVAMILTVIFGCLLWLLYGAYVGVK